MAAKEIKPNLLQFILIHILLEGALIASTFASFLPRT